MVWEEEYEIVRFDYLQNRCCCVLQTEKYCHVNIPKKEKTEGIRVESNEVKFNWKILRLNQMQNLMLKTY